MSEMAIFCQLTRAGVRKSCTLMVFMPHAQEVSVAGPMRILLVRNRDLATAVQQKDMEVRCQRLGV
jgi:hypothetical protein